MSEARETAPEKKKPTPIEICEFFGFDPDKTNSLVIEIKPGDEGVYYRHEGKF